jgi:hypothetical protein
VEKSKIIKFKNNSNVYTAFRYSFLDIFVDYFQKRRLCGIDREEIYFYNSYDN